jgi:hypothetical protein
MVHLSAAVDPDVRRRTCTCHLEKETEKAVQRQTQCSTRSGEWCGRGRGAAEVVLWHMKQRRTRKQRYY